MEYLLLLGLVLLNGVFAMSEIALVTARKARLAKAAEAGDRGAQLARKLGEDPTKFLSTIQIGITSISLLNGIVGEAVLAAPLAQWLMLEGVAEKWAHPLATALVVIVVTYVSIVLGELVPKRLGQISPERIARLVAWPVQLLASITRPFVWLLTASTHAVLHLLRVRHDAQPGVTEEEIEALLAEGSQAGVIEAQEHAIVRNVFRLDDRLLGSLMTPRADLVYLDLDDPLERNLQRIEAHNFMRYPVCRGGLDNLLGVLDARQLLAAQFKGLNGALPLDQLQTCDFVPESLSGMALLEQFRGAALPMAFVVNEYGDLEGLVTLQDLLEAMTGEFHAQGSDDVWAVARQDGSWLLEAAMPIPELKDLLGLKQIPDEDRARYHTLGGMVLQLLGRIPATGECCEWEGWVLEVVDMDGPRIDKLLARRMTKPEQGSPSPQ
ncbi:hemolysin family protein [Chitinilyticum piscinae]|uniref:HlyC/CorC family transporter n=1 Tax=Chitinilyticum piscinae TaxID=2866724 RepID=A0A8J7FKV9_9NEIS|nr:hemolysin family protein [Chitinilyticum piscinae]MBE9609642.1 HlyC/CorC family transporter [Chitinilyticum piscinae]